MAAGITANTVGQPASFAFTGTQIFGGPMSPDVSGAGSPIQKDAMIGDAGPGSTSQGRANVLASYGLSKAAQGPLHSPAFWLVVLLVISVVMLSHVAHLSLR